MSSRKISSSSQHHECPASFRTSDQLTLRKLLECPICNDVSRPPIHTCRDNHHLICGECLKRLSQPKCPICKTPISQATSFLEQCMEWVFLDCKFKDDGCPLTTLKATEYRDHVQRCDFRFIECFIANCGKCIPFKNFFNHLKQDHSDKVNGVDNGNRYIVEFWIDGESPADSARWPPYYFTCFNNVFLYTAISTTHGMWEWASIIADEEEASRFQVISNISSQDKLTQLSWKGAVHPIRRPIRDIACSGGCFVTNSKEMRNPYIFQKEGNPRHFWRTEVEIVEIKPPKIGSTPYIITTEKQAPEPSELLMKLTTAGTTARLSMCGTEKRNSKSDGSGTEKRNSKSDELPNIGQILETLEPEPLLAPDLPIPTEIKEDGGGGSTFEIPNILLESEPQPTEEPPLQPNKSRVTIREEDNLPRKPTLSDLNRKSSRRSVMGARKSAVAITVSVNIPRNDSDDFINEVVADEEMRPRYYIEDNGTPLPAEQDSSQSFLISSEPDSRNRISISYSNNSKAPNDERQSRRDTNK